MLTARLASTDEGEALALALAQTQTHLFCSAAGFYFG